MIGDRVVLRRTVKRKGDSNYDPQEFEVTAKRKGDLTMTAQDGRTVRRHITLAKKIISERHSSAGSDTNPQSICTRVLRPRNELKKPAYLMANVEV